MFIKSYNYAAVGIKLIDMSTICPLTGNLININNFSGDKTDNNILPQSYHYCFALKMVIGQKLKESVSNFNNFYNVLSSLTMPNE